MGCRRTPPQRQKLWRVVVVICPRPATILSTATDLMTRALFPIGFCALCLLIGNATLSTIGAALEAEQAEICHRSGSLDCPPLPR